MHFKQLYPKAKIGYKPEDYPGLVKGQYSATCEFCGIITRWFDIVSRQYCCSSKCLDYTRKKVWFKK